MDLNQVMRVISWDDTTLVTLEHNGKATVKAGHVQHSQELNIKDWFAQFTCRVGHVDDNPKLS